MERWILWETEHTKDTHGSGHLDQTMDLAAWGNLDKGCPESCRTMGEWDWRGIPLLGVFRAEAWLDGFVRRFLLIIALGWK